MATATVTDSNARMRVAQRSVMSRVNAYVRVVDRTVMNGTARSRCAKNVKMRAGVVSSCISARASVRYVQRDAPFAAPLRSMLAMLSATSSSSSVFACCYCCSCCG
jgi:hypothetical protein